MDKEMLAQYIDACELVKETEEDIRRLKKRMGTVTDTVKGSMHDFPYAAQNFKVQGMAYTVVKEPGILARQERILEVRKARAEEIKARVEAWLSDVPLRMQRIIRFRIFDNNTWADVAKRMGRGSTAESVKKEFQRFIKEN